MNSTTRRVSEKELKRIKEIQKLLERQKIKLTQAEISELITAYAIDNFEDFMKTLKKKKEKNANDPLIKWLNSHVEGKEETNVVIEHDETV